MNVDRKHDYRCFDAREVKMRCLKTTLMTSIKRAENKKDAFHVFVRQRLHSRASPSTSETLNMSSIKT